MARARVSPRMGSIDLRRMMLFSAVLRLLLVVYGEWQDAHMEVRYTDVDYLVFSDAAAMVAAGRSPFERSTYRYSPLLAFLLVPNSTIHRSWGKLLFSAAGMEEKCYLSSFFVFFLILAAFLILSAVEFDLSKKLLLSSYLFVYGSRRSMRSAAIMKS